MNQILTTSRHWKVDAYDAAEKGESFSLHHLQPDDVDFLVALLMKFPFPRVWRGDSFYFNTRVGDPAVVATGELSNLPTPLA